MKASKKNPTKTTAKMTKITPRAIKMIARRIATSSAIAININNKTKGIKSNIKAPIKAISVSFSSLFIPEISGLNIRIKAIINELINDILTNPLWENLKISWLFEINPAQIPMAKTLIAGKIKK